MRGRRATGDPADLEIGRARMELGSKKMRIAAGETGRRFHDDLRPGLVVDDEA